MSDFTVFLDIASIRHRLPIRAPSPGAAAADALAAHLGGDRQGWTQRLGLLWSSRWREFTHEGAACVVQVV